MVSFVMTNAPQQIMDQIIRLFTFFAIVYMADVSQALTAVM